MPALSDRTFNPKAWAKLGLVAAALGVLAGLVWMSMAMYREHVEAPRLLGQRFVDPPGRVGPVTTQVSALGVTAVPTLLGDLSASDADQRSKALELLSTIEDPRVIPALAKALRDPDTGVRLAALAGLARTGKPEAAKAVWPLLDSTDEFMRFRAIVVLGLTGARPDADKLLASLKDVDGQERYLQAWAAGRILRRLEKPAPHGYLPASPEPEDEAGAQQQQEEILGLHAALDALEEVQATAMRLSALTDVAFATWDYAHQIGVQVLAVAGPRAVRRTGRTEGLGPPRPTQRKLELKVER